MGLQRVGRVGDDDERRAGATPRPVRGDVLQASAGDPGLGPDRPAPGDEGERGPGRLGPQRGHQGAVPAGRVRLDVAVVTVVDHDHQPGPGQRGEDGGPGAEGDPGLPGPQPQELLPTSRGPQSGVQQGDPRLLPQPRLEHRSARRDVGHVGHDHHGVPVGGERSRHRDQDRPPRVDVQRQPDRGQRPLPRRGPTQEGLATDAGRPRPRHERTGGLRQPGGRRGAGRDRDPRPEEGLLRGGVPGRDGRAQHVHQRPGRDVGHGPGECGDLRGHGGQRGGDPAYRAQPRQGARSDVEHPAVLRPSRERHLDPGPRHHEVGQRRRHRVAERVVQMGQRDVHRNRGHRSHLGRGGRRRRPAATRGRSEQRRLGGLPRSHRGAGLRRSAGPRLRPAPRWRRAGPPPGRSPPRSCRAGHARSARRRRSGRRPAAAGPGRG